MIDEDNIQKIVPDNKFLTRNTKDLEEILRAIPKGLLNTGEEEFEKDFNDILNEKVSEPLLSRIQDFKCPECNFKATSTRVVNAHHNFVHDISFYTCDDCGTGTKTVGAMKQHKWKAHKSIASFKPTKAQSLMVELSEADTSEYEDDSSHTDDDNLPDLYKEHKWDDGYNYKARTPAFEKAASGLKIMLKKSTDVKTVGENKVRVVNVEKHDGWQHADIEIIDDEGSGQVQLDMI